MLDEPGVEFLEPSRRVGKDLVTELAARVEQADVELQLGDVDAGHR